MGLLRTIAMAPLAGPFKSMLWVAQTLTEHAERALYDETTIRRDLARLEEKFEIGKITVEEFERVESDLLERLNQARRMKEGR
jgi:hypothetical protein